MIFRFGRVPSRPAVCMSNISNEGNEGILRVNGIDESEMVNTYASHNCGKFLKDRTGKLDRVSLIIRILPGLPNSDAPSYDYQVRGSLFREFIRGR